MSIFAFILLVVHICIIKVLSRCYILLIFNATQAVALSYLLSSAAPTGLAGSRVTRDLFHFISNHHHQHASSTEASTLPGAHSSGTMNCTESPKRAANKRPASPASVTNKFSAKRRRISLASTDFSRELDFEQDGQGRPRTGVISAVSCFFTRKSDPTDAPNRRIVSFPLVRSLRYRWISLRGRGESPSRSTSSMIAYLATTTRKHRLPTTSHSSTPSCATPHPNCTLRVRSSGRPR